MDIREILTMVRADGRNDAVLTTAFDLARAHGAYVQGLCIYAEPLPALAECYAIGEAAVDEVVDRIDRDTKALIAPVHDAFEARLAAEGVKGGWITLDIREAASEGPLHARLADLVIVARPGEHDADGRRIVELFLVQGGAPCLLVPDDWVKPARFRRIAIAWNGTREAAHAVNAALPLLRRADAVELVIVGNQLDASPPIGITAVTKRLARHDIDAGIAHAPPSHDAAEIILKRCQIFDADLLVMGAYGHSRTSEAILGGASRSTLLHAPLPVLMAR